MIIGTALAAFGGNGALGGLFGGNAAGTDYPTAFQVQEKECADNLALTRSIYDTRITDLQEKFDLYTRLDNKISELEKTTSIVNAQLPLMFQLANVTAERYCDDKACACSSAISSAVANQATVNAAMELQIAMRPVGKVALPFSDLITGVPQMPRIIYNTTTCGCCGDSSVG